MRDVIFVAAVALVVAALSSAITIRVIDAATTASQ